ncbi:DUF262 domain-containing protein [Kocuria sp. SM24M-10]|uniref:DUF262 domain-containing protein n=1 Tax=Kocuria sp. SM24M-10 TaxID=1660349 RepID=UPI00193A274D|nr:DUF262 domain-containing protein [Kocuria sp. SM24M-10]
MGEKMDTEELRQQLISRQKRALEKGEEIGAAIDGKVETPQVSPEKINEKYEKGEIRIVTEQGRYPLASISRMLNGENYKLDPEYQRRHRWSIEQKSRLIESFIMNVPVPPIFLYEWDYNEYEVMDGLQRMTAVREFYENKFPLSSLEYWQELEGMYYKDLPAKVKAGVDRRYISSIVLLKETSHGDENPELLKRFVFGRINTGGVQLTPQELRNALYDGPMNRLCKELSSNPKLRRMWNIPVNVEELLGDTDPAVDNLTDEAFDGLDLGQQPDVPDTYRKMIDVELVLRFFANRQRVIYYRDNLRGYLDGYLKIANNFDSETIESLKRLYLMTIDLAWDIFGDRAFKKRRNGVWGNVPTLSIYDALTNVLSRLIDEGPSLLAKREEIIQGLDEFYANNSAKFNLRGQTRADLMDREILFESYFRSFLK